MQQWTMRTPSPVRLSVLLLAGAIIVLAAVAAASFDPAHAHAQATAPDFAKPGSIALVPNGPDVTGELNWPNCAAHASEFSNQFIESVFYDFGGEFQRAGFESAVCFSETFESGLDFYSLTLAPKGEYQVTIESIDIPAVEIDGLNREYNPAIDTPWGELGFNAFEGPWSANVDRALNITQSSFPIENLRSEAIRIDFMVWIPLTQTENVQPEDAGREYRLRVAWLNPPPSSSRTASTIPTARSRAPRSSESSTSSTARTERWPAVPRPP